MANILQDLSDELGLAYHKNENALYGDYRGYKVIVQHYNSAGAFVIKIPMSSNSDNKLDLGTNLVTTIKASEKRVSEAVFSDNTLLVKLTKALKSESNKESIIFILNEATTFAFTNGFVTTCESCGIENTGNIYEIDNFPMFWCDSCHNSFVNEIKSSQESFNSKEQNIVTGLVGAFVGSLIGVIVWIVVYHLGYIAAISGIVLAVCTIKGYELLGGKLNKVGILLTFIITMIMVYVATYLSYSFEMYSEFKQYADITILEAIKSFKDVKAAYSEISSAFTKDLAMGYLFTLIGATSSFYSAYKTSNFKYKTKSLNQDM